MPYIGKKPADIIATVIDTTTGTFSGEVDAGSLDVSGNADIDGITNLDNTDIDGTLNVQGETTLQTHLNMGDNDIIKLGDSADLQIYHDGSHSYVQDSGTGDLILQAGNDLILRQPDGSTEYLRANEGAGVQIYHNGVQKFLTTSTGIDVTGTVTADDITLSDADTPTLTLTDTTNTLTTFLQSGNSTAVLGTSTAHDIRLQTNSTDAIRIASNGDISFYEDTGTTAKFFWDSSTERLGIGTASPSKVLSLYGSQDQTQVQFNDGTENWYMGSYGSSTGDFYIRSGTNSNIMYLDRAGNVGIGTDSPDDLLHLRATVQTGASLRLENSSTSTDANTVYGTINFEGNDASAGASGIRGSIVGGSDNISGGMSLEFSTAAANSSNTERMRISSDGNVGIGTTSPNGKLEVSANSATTGPVIRLSNLADTINANGTHGSIEFFSGDNSNPADQVVTSIKSIHPATAPNYGELAFSTGSNAEAMRIDSSGNVGIGTDSPLRQLSIANASNAEISFISGTSSNASILFGDGITGTDVYRGYIQYQHPIDSMIFATSVAERMRIDSSGNLLVGTTAYTGNTTSAGAGFFDSSGVKICFASGAGTTGIFNRLTSDGDIVSFRKDGSPIGSIQASGTNMVIGNNGDVCLVFVDGATDRVQPANTDRTSRDNAIDLGVAAARFKDLYLSGGVYLGGTGSANLLDDYEEGTWTPVAEFSSANPTAGAKSGVGSYIKVGKLCTVTCSLDNINVTGASGDFKITGLPFGGSTRTSIPIYMGAVRTRSLTVDDGYLVAQIQDGVTHIDIFENNYSSGGDNINTANCSHGASDFNVTITYETN